MCLYVCLHTYVHLFTRVSAYVCIRICVQEWDETRTDVGPESTSRPVLRLLLGDGVFRTVVAVLVVGGVRHRDGVLRPPRVLRRGDLDGTGRMWTVR